MRISTLQYAQKKLAHITKKPTGENFKNNIINGRGINRL
jgi:hypothetical protein